MKKQKKTYTKPTIKSSKISLIHLYSKRDHLKGSIDGHMLAYIAC